MTRSTCANESCCFCAAVGEAQESRPSQSACSACRLRRGEPPSECNDLSLVDHLEQPPRTLPHVSDLTACQAHLQRGTVAADARGRCQICPPWHGDIVAILELPLPDHSRRDLKSASVSFRRRSTMSAGSRLTRISLHSSPRSLSSDAKAMPLSMANTRSPGDRAEMRKLPALESPCRMR